MPTDLEIAQSVRLRHVTEVGEMVGLSRDELELYGRYKAKITRGAADRRTSPPRGKLILVTAITPTPAGEGKTTLAIGLSQALWKMGKNSIVAIREPSLGPTFGLKGGATGGGYAQVVPMEDINLHFTGDFHAITYAHNLLLAMLDNHLHHGNELGIDPRTISFNRCIDLCDRALRHIIVGLGGPAHGVPREAGFEVTAASELMGVLTLTTGLPDLKRRLARLVVAFDRCGKPVTAADLKADGAMATLMKDAIKPNLVQTLEGTPAFIHAGPFANVSCGCSSVIATELALDLADYVVTESGFGSDLGAEKFFHILCRQQGWKPNAVVMAVTVRALKLHGGAKLSDLKQKNLAQVEWGLENLWKHVENMSLFGVPCLVALNRFADDDSEEVELVFSRCKERSVPIVMADVWAKGSEGGMELARAVTELAEQPSNFRVFYELNESIEEKIKTVATMVYGADGVDFTTDANKSIAQIEQAGYSNLPVCMCKTHLSLSDDGNKKGRPRGWRLTVRDVRLAAGAEFLIVYCGNILVMPGLQPHPAAEGITISDDGVISGMF